MSIEGEKRIKKEQYSKKLLEAGVQAIIEGRGLEIFQRSQIPNIVEKPLVSTVEILYDKNIKTYDSSANSDDVEARQRVGVSIYYDLLSKENKKIAESIGKPSSLGDEDSVKGVYLGMSVAKDTTIDEIEKTMESLASKFKKQPLSWIKRLTIEEMRKEFGIDENDESFTPESFTKGEWVWYWSEDEQLFYPSEEMYKKYKESENLEKE